MPPHTAHFASFTPASVQVAAFVTTHWPQVCAPVAGIASVFVALHTAHFASFTPATVQVAAFVTVHSPQVCAPVAGST